MNHESRAFRRPLSPHLQIYRVQLTSLMSALHRITGLLLFVALHLWILWLVSVQIFPLLHDDLREVLNFWPVQGGVWFLVWCLAYHLWNGLRHLVWDAGYAVALRAVYTTGYGVWILSVVTVALIWGSVCHG